MIGWGFTGPNRSLRYPTLMGLSVSGFVLPQVVGAFNNVDSNTAYQEGLWMFILMAVLCMAAAWAGEQFGFRRPGKRLTRLADFDPRRILEAALILNFISVGTVLLARFVFSDEIAAHTTTEGGMSGAAVIVIFFAAVQRYGFALALLLYWQRRSALALAMGLLGAFNYVATIVFMARRGPAIEFMFIVLITYAFGRRRQIPAFLVTFLFIGGTLWNTAIGEFRNFKDDRSFFEKMETADYWRSFQETLDRGGLEVLNACDVIATTYEQGSYEYGKLHWNKLVHAYFPGQIFGYDRKNALKFDIEDIAVEANRRRGTTGATETGMADCFSSFGFFGCVKYLVIGFVMGRWARRSFQGHLPSQLAYSTLMSSALHTVSHGTPWLINDYIHMAIFSYPVLYWARKPAAAIAARAARRPRAGPAEPSFGIASPGLR
jgi:hypothetical protein